ncbi:hypothetical protein [Planktothricoides raciborskii]|uniref:Uncharacterized protein n=1 Tax=Planktothricoides raciborskii GIHE-MW2 TaxID=2792601 RepID=A0AAU8J5Q9_9CYAN
MQTLQGHDNAAIATSFHPDGDLIASAGADGIVNIWRLDGTLLQKIPAHEHIIYSVSFNGAGNLLATTSEDRTIKLWQGKNLALLKTIKIDQSPVYCIRFRGDR